MLHLAIADQFAEVLTSNFLFYLDFLGAKTQFTNVFYAKPKGFHRTVILQIM